MPEPDSSGDGTRAAAPSDLTATFKSPDAVPARIGKFEVRQVLGEGAFGRVFLGFDAELDRPVAIKVPKPEGFTPDMRERFLREARATAKIHHPNVCPVLEVGAEGDLPYIVMHYLAGTTLAAHLDKWKVIPPLNAIALAQKLALGMAAAHEKGVIHRDLKPQNVLFDPARNLVLITDFGLARIGGQASATAAGAVFGTPLYMSPEQARGDVDAVGPPSDVYSLGVILYRMLTGAVPFEGGVYEVLLQHCEKPPAPPSAVRRGLDIRLDGLVLKALAKKPADRYASAKAFAEALGGFLHSGDSTAWQLADATRARAPANPVPAAPPPVPPIPPAGPNVKLGGDSGKPPSHRPAPAPEPPARRSGPPRPAAPAARREPLPPDDADEVGGSARRKVLIGGVLVLFAGLVVVLALVLGGKKSPSTEQAAVPPPSDPGPAPAPVNPNPDPKKDDPNKKKEDLIKKVEPPKEVPSIANGFAGHKFDQEAERRAAEWVLSVGGELKITPAAGDLKLVTKKEGLPASFTVSRIDVRAQPTLPEEAFKTNLAGLSGPVEVYFRDCGQFGDDAVRVLARVPKLKTLFIMTSSRVTDASLAAIAGHPALTELFLQNTSVTKDGVKHVPSLTQLLKLTLVVPGTDEWLPVIAPMEGLVVLGLNASNPNLLTAAGLPLLKPFKNLRHIAIVGRELSDDWLEKLVAVTAGFPELYELDFREAAIEGPGVVHLKKLPQLDWIDLGHSRITDAGMANLAALPKLRWLFLDGTTVSDAGLQALPKSKTLEVLTLKDNKKVTNKGLAYLADCEKLKELDLTNTNVGDAGARALAKSALLKKLDLTGTGVSATAIKELKESLPGCEIFQGGKK